MEISEDEGVKMIQFLLNLMGQSEPEEISRANWKQMSEHEKEVTISTYKLFNKEGTV